MTHGGNGGLRGKGVNADGHRSEAVDRKPAPLNDAIFGPNPEFTGEMVAGEITIATPSILPMLAAEYAATGTPAP